MQRVRLCSHREVHGSELRDFRVGEVIRASFGSGHVPIVRVHARYGLPGRQCHGRAVYRPQEPSCVRDNGEVRALRPGYEKKGLDAAGLALSHAIAFEKQRRPRRVLEGPHRRSAFGLAAPYYPQENVGSSWDVAQFRARVIVIGVRSRPAQAESWHQNRAFQRVPVMS